MNRHRVVAIGRDPYWLNAVAAAAWAAIAVETIPCQDDYPACLEHLPAADPEALLLVDATGHADVAAVTCALRARGWRYAVVVAADPSTREARAVLREGTAYDYWPKSWSSRTIRRALARCVKEIWEGDP
ncbi:MAG: hypothetical protein JXA09_11265 [Anaerolineae bacterium]|nr:hypothetical protein [Anaerolineae bacterium]